MKVLATIIARNVKEFLYEDVICQFGIPKILILDNRNSLTPRNFAISVKNLVLNKDSLLWDNPQTSGATDVTNRTILKGLKKRIDELKGKWLDEFSNVLWSYRTTPRRATGKTPFNLYFGVDAMIPIEIRSTSLRNVPFNEAQNNQLMHEHLVLINEIREQTTKRDVHYKRQAAR